MYEEMISKCCLALIIVLIILIIVILVIRNKLSFIRAIRSGHGNLPTDEIVKNIKYSKTNIPIDLPDKNKYDNSLGLFTLRTCQSAQNRKLGADLQLPSGVKEVGWIGDHALILKINPKLFTIAIAGTLTYDDLRADLDVQLIDFYDTGAHAGFVNKWKNKIWPSINKFMMQNSNAKFIITGHSLGAAIATLTAVSIGIEFPHIQTALYASATPRTGSSDFNNLLSKTVPNRWHIVNRNDIVPTLPPSVTPILSRPNIAIYSNFDRVIYFDYQGGTLALNHKSRSYISELEKNNYAKVVL